MSCVLYGGMVMAKFDNFALALCLKTSISAPQKIFADPRVSLLHWLPLRLRRKSVCAVAVRFGHVSSWT